MLNVLVNAYAVSPTWGSEPGVGWNWVVHLAQYCRVFVITEGEWREEIEAALEQLPQRANLRFYFNPISPKVRRMCWNQGDWRFYWYYRQWQKRTLRLARDIIAQHRIDVIHQLNMIGFREPGYLWTIKDIPFVWGPIGGMDLMPINYLKGTGIRQSLFCRLKNLINTWQYKHATRVKTAIKRADALIAAVKGVQDVLHNYYSKDAPLINETGTTLTSIVKRNKKTGADFNIIWVGKFDFRKRLDLALQIIAAVKNPNVQLHICGTGTLKQKTLYRELAKECGIASQCHWYGRIEHEKIFSMMMQCDLFLFTSIMEASSTVVLEAISVGLPILSFNTCGFGPMVKDFAGVAIELTTPEQSIKEFALQIVHFMTHPEKLEAISQAEIEMRECCSWESKAKQTIKIYENIIHE